MNLKGDPDAEFFPFLKQDLVVTCPHERFGCELFGVGAWRCLVRRVLTMAPSCSKEERGREGEREREREREEERRERGRERRGRGRGEGEKRERRGREEGERRERGGREEGERRERGGREEGERREGERRRGERREERGERREERGRREGDRERQRETERDRERTERDRERTERDRERQRETGERQREREGERESGEREEEKEREGEREGGGGEEREESGLGVLPLTSHRFVSLTRNCMTEWRVSQRRGRQGRERAMLAQDLLRLCLVDAPRERRSQRSDARQEPRASKEYTLRSSMEDERRRQLRDRFCEAVRATTGQCDGTSGICPSCSKKKLPHEQELPALPRAAN